MILGAASKQDDSSNEQLLRLYWNRAVVKRELNSLQKERHDLLEKLKDQEEEIHRAKEQLSGLERLLVNPIAAANAMVYFQLRHLWRIGTQHLERYRAELALQLEKRERAALHEAALAKRRRRLEALNENIELLREKRKATGTECARLRERLEGMNPLIRLFRGPSLRKRIGDLTEEKEDLEVRVSETEQLAEKLEGEPLPEPDGLSIENRRIINTALIALAQHLALHFAEKNLTSLARKATEKSVADMRFGDRSECDQMVEEIRARIASLDSQENLSAKVRERASQLSRVLQYRDETAATPSPFSTSSISPIAVDGNLESTPDSVVRINVLADDYFDLSHYLSD